MDELGALVRVLTIDRAFVREHFRVTLRSLGRLLSMNYYYFLGYAPTLSLLFLSCVVLTMPL